MAESSQKAAPKRKKAKISVPSGQAHIKASRNNTIISISDSKGGVLTWSSCGACGFKGSKKNTAYAAQVAATDAAEKAHDRYGMKSADVFVSGIGLGRDSAIRAIQQAGINVSSISDTTKVAHAGCRPKKARRG